jgi:serine/threonine protein kinase
MELCDITLHSYIYDKNPDYMEPLYSEVQEGKASVVKTCVLWEIIWDIARGLEFVHGHKEVHRDLKPRNGKNILI